MTNTHAFNIINSMAADGLAYFIINSHGINLSQCKDVLPV